MDPDDQLLTLIGVAKLLPPNPSGKPTHERTVRNWITRGVQTRAGGIAKLAAIKIGGRRLVRLKDFREFIRAQNPPSGG